MLASSRGGHIALAHNGNITNAGELRVELEDLGSIFASSMDSEVIVHRLARSTAERPEDRLADALPRCRGRVQHRHDPRRHAARRTRSARVATTRDGAAQRRRQCSDQRPVRSTSWAPRTSATSSRARSSPSTPRASGRIFPFERKELKRCVFEHVYFARPDSRIFGGSVDRARRELGRRLARECPAPGAELVFSVPDSSNSAAIGYAEQSGTAVRARAHPESLRRPHVHPADAGDPRCEGAAQVQRGARSARGQARRDGGRLHRPRHHDARPRLARARRRCRARCTCASARRPSPVHATTASTRRAARS